MITWIGLDSSLTAFGFCVMRANEGHPFGLGLTPQEPIAGAPSPWLLEVGVWKTKRDQNAKTKASDTLRRVDQLAGHLKSLVSAFHPSVVFVEGMIFLPRGGIVVAAQLGRVRGMVDGVCAAMNVPLREFDPKRVKHAIAGGKGASKEQVAAIMRRQFHQLEALDDNATDAAAVAWVGAHSTPFDSLRRVA